MRGWGPFKTVKIQPCHSVLRNRSPIDYRRRERSCSSPEKGVIIIFPISVSIVFLKVRHNKHLWRATQECHQSKVLDDVSFFKGFVWAKPQKWTFIRLGPGSALRVKRRKNSRADRDSTFSLTAEPGARIKLTRTLLIALSLTCLEISFVVKGAGAIMLLWRSEYKTSVMCHNVNVKIARRDRPHMLASHRCETFEDLLHIDIASVRRTLSGILQSKDWPMIFISINIYIASK